MSRKAGPALSATRRAATRSEPLGYEADKQHLRDEIARTVASQTAQRKHPLAEVLEDVMAQVTRGKGDARHGGGRDSTVPENFWAQGWLVIAHGHGPGFLTGQAEKKTREGIAPAHAERRTELLGAIAYLGMAILYYDVEFQTGGE